MGKELKESLHRSQLWETGIFKKNSGDSITCVSDCEVPLFCTPLTAVINFESRYFLIVFISAKTGHARLLFFLKI